MLVHPRQVEIRLPGRYVVDQHAYPHTAVGRTKNPLRQYAPCGIVLPDIVLSVYGSLSLI